MHDFDALANLRYLKKLGKLKEVRIIGVPPDMDESETIESVGKIIEGLVIRD
jgi:pyruvate-formate lyase-activating enzyme